MRRPSDPASSRAVKSRYRHDPAMFRRAAPPMSIRSLALAATTSGWCRRGGPGPTHVAARRHAGLHAPGRGERAGAGAAPRRLGVARRPRRVAAAHGLSPQPGRRRPTTGENAEWELAMFKSFGWDAHIETFQGALSDADHRQRRPARAPFPTTPSCRRPTSRATRRQRYSRTCCRRIWPIRATATSPRRSSTSITACPMTTAPWRARVSTCGARSCWLATAAAGAG